MERRVLLSLLIPRPSAPGTQPLGNIIEIELGHYSSVTGPNLSARPGQASG